MSIEPRQFEFLQALVKRGQRLREESRPTEFMLLQLAGPSWGLKPGVDGEDVISPREADILDLSDQGFLRILATSSPSVVARFALTPAGRSAGQKRAVTANIQSPSASSPRPAADSALAWLDKLAASTSGAAILDNGGALVNEALSIYGRDHVESVARSILDLRDEGLLRFEDPGADLDQILDSDRVGMAAKIRLTSAGVDRVRDRERPPPPIIQIVHAAEAQVVAGDINNYNSFDDLLDRVEDALAGLVEIDDDAREEAGGMLHQLRAATGAVTMGAATSAGGALLGAVLKQTLGLP